ncbi:hypothetical protein CIL03_05130 [Virgibacillus indicus]|uniref:DinB-like domain-containing protein n=1 Tax=Virgibacillus indicus TaxID=2024554 RepID=A0A265NFC4_9BACI|nr:DinB family protein [Virgibacillus indicus]OZU90531.1 hypothetical protein CIL03_05130 [Virgibacillus indicus]
MSDTKDLILELEQFTSWVLSLQTIEERLFFKPIKEGKWSPAEIITHITFWDRYIVDEMLPAMNQNAKIESVEFEVINSRASKHAMSGISKKQIIDNQIIARNNVISLLREKTDEEFFAKFTLNGEEIDPYSGYPHTMYNYFAGFAWHDNHHKKQIEVFLNENSITLLK